MSDLSKKKCIPCEGNIPPFNNDSSLYFKEINILNNELNLSELSMGMSSDYIEASKPSATFLRIGSSIFGSRN